MKLKLGVALLALVSAVLMPSSLFADSDALPQAAPLRPTSGAGSYDAARAYASLPLHFEPTSEQGRFLARSGGYSVLIGAGESAIGIPGEKAGPMRVLRFTFDHANAAAQLEAIEPLPGVANYYVGQDPSKWRLGVRTFAKLRTKDVYPGVDVVYYGDHRRLEFDFVVAPMANAGAIALTLSGMDKLYVNTDGDLVAEVNGQPLRFAKPYAYQKVAGLAKRVSAEYALSAPNKAELKLGDYDKNRELVIDPIMSYSTYLGGSQADTANGIAVDASGNAYITGQTASSDFPAPSPNPSGTSFIGSSTGAKDAYITKLSADGSTVLFTTFIAGTNPLNGFASGNGIALDNLSLNPTPVNTGIACVLPLLPCPVPNGPHVYVAGTASFHDLPGTGTGTYGGAESDAFVLILDQGTGALLRSTYLGGSQPDAGNAIAVDPQQNVIVAGQTSSADFPAYNGFEPYTEKYVAFVTKLDFGLHIATPVPNGSAMSRRPSSNTDSCATGAPCPATPNASKTYYFFSALYGGQVVPPPATWTYAVGASVPYGAITWVTPYNCPVSTTTSNPAELVFAQNGGTAEGINWGSCTTNTVGDTITDIGGINWLVLAIAPPIQPPNTSTEAYGVALDPVGDVFVVGGSGSSDLRPSLPGGQNLDWLKQAYPNPPCDGTSGGACTGAWIVKVLGNDTYMGSQNAGWPVYVYALQTIPEGPQYVNAARAVAVDNENRAYVVGTATGGIQPGYVTTLNKSQIGGQDAFILRISNIGSAVEYGTYLGGTGDDQGLGVAVDSGGAAYIAGSTLSTDLFVINPLLDMNQNSMATLRGPQDAYLAEIDSYGNTLFMTSYLGGSGVDQANAIALSKPGTGGVYDIYVAGNTTSRDFPLAPNAAPANPVPGRTSYAGNGNTTEAFVTRISGASFPSATASPTSLNFGTQAVKFGAPTQTVTLTSTGPAPLTIPNGGITVSGDYSQANDCGTGLDPKNGAHSTCTITLTFTPTAENTRYGTLTIVDNATNSPQSVGLTGTGALVADSVAPTTLTFGNVTVGATSTAQTVTVTNTASLNSGLTLVPGTAVATGDFTVSANGCNQNLAPQGTCTVGVTFTPTQGGRATGLWPLLLATVPLYPRSPCRALAMGLARVRPVTPPAPPSPCRRRRNPWLSLRARRCHSLSP